jgi:predicted ATP-dependent endonuclease of OLD family
MKLKQFQVTMFQSILDTDPVAVDDVTCLVGKNEAGKSAILNALYRINPIRTEDANFNVTDDYPRSEVSDYEDEVARGKRSPEQVVQVKYELEDDDVEAVEAVFGPSFLRTKVLTIAKSYDNKRVYDLSADEHAAIMFMSRNLTNETKEQAEKSSNAKEFAELLEPLASDAAVAAIIAVVRECKEHSFSWYAFNKLLIKREPQFLYFDEYYQMRGCENVEALQKRVAEKKLEPSDHPLLGLIELARLDLAQLVNPQRTQELKNKLEGAGNHLTRQILPYWSQNKHLHMRFDVRPARPADPEGMRGGTNIWGEVYDTKHLVSTGLGTRSRGFVWFFSFVAWYSQIKRRDENVILLLDEPGLTLHGRAQGDLLRYFETELKPNHQVIYTTHSPFMVDPTHFERVRIVQDLSIDRDDLPRERQGTKVTREVLEATDDSLFPLQGALGYEIHQTLFIGPNSLLVEGPADLLFIQGMSTLLGRDGREGLSDSWTLTPVGGAGRVPTFVRLLTNQKGMLVATLIDVQDSDRATVEGLYKGKLLKRANVRTFADYTGAKEADIEDMFDENFYLDLVNAEYKSALKLPLKASDFKSRAPRVLQRLESYIGESGNLPGAFSHYRPARYFHENLEALAKKISDATKDRFERAFKDLNGLLAR